MILELGIFKNKCNKLRSFLNNLIRITMFLIFSITLICILPKATYAHEDSEVKIKNLNVKVELMKDGSLFITEDLQMYFDGRFNGAFKDISTLKTDGMDNLKVYLIDKKNTMEILPVLHGKNGDKEVYEIDKKSSSYRIKIYMPSKNEERTFRVSYRLLNCAKVYSDIGEIYYNFWDKGYETKVENFQGTIVLPEESDIRDIRAFAQGPLNITCDILDSKTIKFKTKGIGKSQYISGRVVFPKKIVSDSKNKINRKELTTIVQEEKKYEEQRNKKIKFNNNMNIVCKNGSFIVVLFNIFLIFLYVKISKRTIEQYNISLLPIECSPVVMAEFYKRTLSGVDFIATLIDLSRRGYLTIQTAEEDPEDYIKRVKKNKKKEEDYKIIFLNGDNGKLLQHERYFLDWLLKASSYTGSIKMSDLSKISKKDPYKFSDNFRHWTTLVKKEAKERGYYDSSKSLAGSLYILGFVVGLALSIVIGIYAGPFAILPIVFSIVTFILGIVLLCRISDFAYSEKLKWQEIKKAFTKGNYEFGIEQYDFNMYLPYLISMGVYVKYFNRFRNFALKHEPYCNNIWLMNYLTFDHFDNNSSFIYWGNHYFETTSAGSSMESGGSSVGGGGGCGGGGAGGF